MPEEVHVCAVTCRFHTQALGPPPAHTHAVSHEDVAVRSSQQKCTQLICKPRMGIIWVRLKHIMLMGRSSLELNGFCQDCPLRVLSTQILSARTDCNYVRAAQRCARRGAHCVDDCLRALCFGTSKKVLKCICLAQRGMQVHTSARAPPRQP